MNLLLECSAESAVEVDLNVRPNCTAYIPNIQK